MTRSSDSAAPLAEIADDRTATKKDAQGAFSYLKDWTPEYAATAEFELVVQKQHLPVHKHVMSMSPVFQRELFKTESKRSLLNASLKKKTAAPVATRMQLSSPLFMEVSVEDMCLLLSYVYPTDATLSPEKMDEVRRLFALTEEFEFHSITRRCVNFLRSAENLAPGLRADLETNDATAASEWLELAVKWNFVAIKDELCDFAGENFLKIYGREVDEEPEKKWADMVMVLDSEIELWKRIARSQALRIESGPRLADLISDEPSTTLIYGVIIGIFVRSILPSWMFFLILIGTIWYVVQRMPPGLLFVIQQTLEGAMRGILHGDSVKSDKVENGSAVESVKPTAKNKGKPPVLRRSGTHVTA